MKWFIAIISLTIVVCSAALAENLQSELMTKEEMLWTAWGKKDAEIFKKHLTKDSVQIGSSGSFSGIESIVKAMQAQSCDMRVFSAQKVEMRNLSPDIVVLNYVVTQDGICNGEKLSSPLSATSIYVKKDGRWLAAHYHESPLKGT